MNWSPFLAQAVDIAFALAWWKMLLMYLPYLGWAWLIATKLDKDARHFNLNSVAWNSAHLAAGFFSFMAMIFIPKFWAGWPVGVAIMLAPILFYWKVRNAEVPEAQRFYITGASIAGQLQARRQKKAARAAMLTFVNSEGKDVLTPMKDEPFFDTHIISEDIIGPALETRVSRLDMTITAKGCVIGHIIDGVRYKKEPISTEDGLKLFDYLKELSGLDVSDKRRLQRGRCGTKGPEGKTKLSIITAGSSGGQTMKIEFDLDKRLNKPFDSLGLLSSQREALRPTEEIHDRHGIILMGAPRSHGLTTTSYSILGRHDAYISNIKTLEREIFLILDGPDQIQFDPSNPDVDYMSNLQSILRRDPDLVLCDEIQDSETAQLIAESGMDGPLLYIPQVMSSVVEQIRSWVKLVGDVKLATRSLRIVMNQRLLRTLCTNCRQAYKPSAEQLRKLNLPASKVSELFRAGGKVEFKGKVEECPICNGLGFLGQVGVFEVLVVTDEIRKILGTGDLKAALAHARRERMIYLQEAALSKVISGETSIEEVLRITSTQTKETAGDPSAAA